MNEWDELQRRNWGEPNQLPLSAYADVLRQAIGQALATRSDIQVSTIKLTITDAHISITAEISYTSLNAPMIEDTTAQEEADITILGEEDG